MNTTLEEFSESLNTKSEITATKQALMYIEENGPYVLIDGYWNFANLVEEYIRSFR